LDAFPWESIVKISIAAGFWHTADGVNLYITLSRRIDFSQFQFHDAFAAALKKTQPRYSGPQITQHPLVKGANLPGTMMSLAIRAHVHCIIGERISDFIVLP
jgi:hypothetical protein